MDIATIETFLKVASTQNISKTAQQIGYSQSTVTMQIQKLEKELGVKLFERIGKHIYLTTQGRAFIPYANNLLKAKNEALTFASNENDIVGQLRIGGVESICTGLLPELLIDFHKHCPHVEVIVRSGNTTDMINLLCNNELDFVFTLDQKIYRHELECKVEQPEEIIFLTLANDSYTKDIIPIQKLCCEPFILTEANAAYRYILEQMLIERDLHIQPILEIGNTETIIKLLKQGLGISYLPRFTVEKPLQEKTLMELHTNLPSALMYHQLLIHKQKMMTKQMELFIKLVKNYFQQRKKELQ